MQSALRFTTADLETFPDTLDDTRYEIIGGELFVAHQPHTDHQRTAGVVWFVLADWSRSTGLGEPIQAPGLIFTDEDNVAPDVIWISNERLARGLGDDGKLHIAPELIVEVLSPGNSNIHRDREAKLKLYSATGVDEYWIADWRERTVDVFRRNGGALTLVATLTDDDTLTSPVLPGFACPVRSLWSFPRA
jgi:Uma2 family endonuclease